MAGGVVGGASPVAAKCATRPHHVRVYTDSLLEFLREYYSKRQIKRLQVHVLMAEAPVPLETHSFSEAGAKVKAAVMKLKDEKAITVSAPRRHVFKDWGIEIC